jgi:protein tyrosine/serine phosphatase
MKKFMLKAGLAVGVLLLTSGGLWLFLFKQNHNLRTVVPGVAYRSGQMRTEDLTATIHQLGIRGIINLRGANSTSPWFQEETTVCQHEGVKHYDVALSARQLPSPEAVRTLLQDFADAPRPLLIHCQAGADRTGLATVLYLMTQEKMGEKEAVAQGLNWHFGHLPFRGYEEMDEFFTIYEKSGQNKSFDHWLAEDYPRLYEEDKVEDGW